MRRASNPTDFTITPLPYLVGGSLLLNNLVHLFRQDGVSRRVQRGSLIVDMFGSHSSMVPTHVLGAGNTVGVGSGGEGQIGHEW